MKTRFCCTVDPFLPEYEGCKAVTENPASETGPPLAVDCARLKVSWFDEMDAKLLDERIPEGEAATRTLE